MPWRTSIGEIQSAMLQPAIKFSERTTFKKRKKTAWYKTRHAETIAPLNASANFKLESTLQATSIIIERDTYKDMRCTPDFHLSGIWRRTIFNHWRRLSPDCLRIDWSIELHLYAYRQIERCSSWWVTTNCVKLTSCHFEFLEISCAVLM